MSASRLAPFVGLYVAYAAFLHAVDGPWRQWKAGREGSVLDPWSATHLAWGALARRMGVGFGELLVLGIANELAESWASQNRPDLLWGEGERSLNTLADLALNQAGWLAGGAP